MMDIPKTHLVQPSEINRNAPKINLQGKQCDQMLEYKVAQFRRKVSQIFSTAVFTQIGIFSQKAKKMPNIWATFARKFVIKAFQK